jgi:hypothetical protein
MDKTLLHDVHVKHISDLLRDVELAIRLEEGLYNAGQVGDRENISVVKISVHHRECLVNLAVSMTNIEEGDLHPPEHAEFDKHSTEGDHLLVLVFSPAVIKLQE